uniref:Predicted protein n=1 Tax=Hordeum vulgare subsp. vulgare TaxID=112509 RepID=F2DAH9_HORVV|nr:predicted protein [Hordeum vulgare subsp. vulgare]
MCPMVSQPAAGNTPISAAVRY